MGDQAPPESAVENYEKMRKEAVMQPRVISVTGFQNVFDLALLNSCLRRR